MATRVLVLLAHGSRAEEAPAELLELCRRVGGALPGVVVRGAFLSLAAPDLPGAVEDAISQGAAEIRVLPLFLFSGKHLRHDIPAILLSLRDRHPGVSLVLLDPIGRQDGFADFVRAASGPH